METNLTVIHFRALIGYMQYNQEMLKFILTLCRNSDMFWSIFIVFRELGGLSTLTIMYIVFVGSIKFMVVLQNWFIRCGGCSFIGFYNCSYKEDVNFVLAYHNITLIVLSL